MKRLLIPTLAVLSALTLQTAAQAHYIWATIENHRVRFALLENLNEDPSAKFEKYVAELKPEAAGTPVSLGAAKDGARYADLMPGQDIVVAESIVGAKKREGPEYLLIYHAKGAATLASAGVETRQPEEILARREGSGLVLTVHRSGVGVAQNEVSVQWPGEEPVSIKTDANGVARIAWPATVRPGFIGIRTMITEAKAGTLASGKYTEIHHWTTLTFPAIEPKLAP